MSTWRCFSGLSSKCSLVFHPCFPVAATEMVFSNICSFFPGKTFILIFQVALSVHRTHTNFPGGRSVCSSNRCYFSRKPCLFVKHIPLSRSSFLFFAGTHCVFSWSLYFLIEQILIFQEALSSRRKHVIFQQFFTFLAGCFRCSLFPCYLCECC